MDKPWHRRTPRPLSERFWEKVDRGPGCWLWMGARTAAGYGAIGAGGKGGKMLVAHRAALVLSGVDVPDDAVVCHRCDVRACVRPSHLYVGTFSDNNRDTAARNPAWRLRKPGTGANIAAALRAHYSANPRSNHEAQKTHCPQGHPYDEANTYWFHGTKRMCRACNRERQRERLARRKAA